MQEAVIMSGSQLTTIVGLTFLGAALFTLIILLISFNGFMKKNKTPEAQAAPAAAPSVAVVAAPQEDESEIVAAIMAAVAAMGAQENTTFTVRHIRRNDGSSPAWGKAGRADILSSKL